MTTDKRQRVERQWTRAGILFLCRPADSSPDLERLLLTTCVAASANPRLPPLVVTWIVQHGKLIARHRLRRLAIDEGSAQIRAVLGLIIESAITFGASRELRAVISACHPVSTPRPLFDVHRLNAIGKRLAEQNASALSRKWGVLAPEFELKADAVRPAEWILAHNPAYHARAIRKGDLRCSILETLRLDADGAAGSESELARLSGATRAGARKALASLVAEGEVTVGIHTNARDRGVSLRGAA